MELNLSVSLWNYIHYFPLKKGGTNFAFENGLEGMAVVVDDLWNHGFGVEPWAKWTSWMWTSPSREGLVADETDLFHPRHHKRLSELLGRVRSTWHTGNEDTLEEYQRQIDTVAVTGSKALVVHAGNLFLAEPTPDYGFAREVLQGASAKNVTIALENASEGEADQDPSMWNLEILKRALAKLPDLMVCLDTMHTQKYRRHPLRQYIDVLKDRLCHLHISDAFAPEETFARMHTTPGHGS